MKRTQNSDRVKHLFSRMAFGLRYADLERLREKPLKRLVRQMVREGMKTSSLEVAGELLQSPKRKGGATEMEIKEFNRFRNQQEAIVNIGWIQKMNTTENPFLEKMTLFWHGHFACRMNNGYYLEQLNNIQRTHALGNFRTLVLEVAKSPAMLSFLNNQQNRKDHPNENFARELMELFTLGRGNYTEKDIRESGRAFTGWQYRQVTGAYSFNAKQHDNGMKVFFGKQGNFGGEDIVDMILAKPEAAYFVAGKVYQFFVNEIPDKEHIREMADVFYQSGYEIKPMMEAMLNSEWFYNSSNVGNKIKSPIELLVGLNRVFGVQYAEPKVLLQLQRSLGQVLFYPPNVAGWSGGRNWIDSSSLLTRMKLPSTILNGGIIESEGKTDPEDEAFLASARKQRLFVERKTQSKPDWERFKQDIPHNIDKDTLSYLLIAGGLNARSLNAVDGESIENIVMQLVSLPEYQLC